MIRRHGVRARPVASAVFLAVIFTMAFTVPVRAQQWTLIGWNDLGMHCTDGFDFSTFSVLPPYNTIHAQIMDPSGKLVTQPSGILVTYEAVRDADQSLNTTSIGKTNFWSWVKALFGASPAPDTGLAGFSMPGSANTARPMTFDTTRSWFTAEGIPLTPFPDGAFSVTPPSKNFYPMMRLTARDTSGNVLATTDIVLPISDEMDCRSCHASGSNPPAQPVAGWVYDPDPNRDVKLNILRLHDDLQANDSTYGGALASIQASPSGLYATATQLGRPILCASCHASNALGTAGYPGVMQFTSAMHALHASVVDPSNGLTLESSQNRFACYRCHPGAATRCLRGVMGNSVALDGSMAIQCQNCHGTMNAVGSPDRLGWFNEPNCQSCHTGTATSNSGSLRYTSVFSSAGVTRTAADSTFATNPNTPAANLSLYRFSTGHGALQCEACHGSTHAEWSSSHPNDNVQSIELQGHAGMVSDCDTCHGALPSPLSAGPTACILSARIGQPRTPISRKPRGRRPASGVTAATIGGPCSHGRSATARSRPASGPSPSGAVFKSAAMPATTVPRANRGRRTVRPWRRTRPLTTAVATPVQIALQASDPDANPLTFRVVSQPIHGTVGLSGNTATYFPEPNFTGTEGFTFAAWDGYTNSNLASGTVTVQNVVCTVACSATVPATAAAGSAVALQASATLTGCPGGASFDWNYGDGSPHGSTGNPTHTYARAGNYNWTLQVSSGGAICTRTGTIVITSPCSVACTATVPATARLNRAASFKSTVKLSNCSSGAAFDWNFGDGAAHSSAQNVSHTYRKRGLFHWTLTVSAGGVTCTRAGTISVS